MIDLHQMTDALPVTEASRLRVRRIRLEIAGGPDAGQKLDLDGPEVIVGGGDECDVVLRDRAVSRRHLQLRVEGRGLRVTDLASRNGTTIDGLAILDAVARPDSEIRIGQTTLHLRLLDDQVELPLSRREEFGALIGRSIPMRRLFTLLERIAPTDTTVLIHGETGTGKELIAEALHDQAPRASGPFVVFDCSAVTASLMESELFGHVRGAFTGAVSDRAGALEAADGGTLFLDEIGELPLELQPKLLRALERREVRRVGSHERRQVDVRIVAATHRDLAAEVERGRFREDLYYRLAVVRVAVPPLREHADDIPLLVQSFVRQLSRDPGAGLPEATVRRFQQQRWPGNVRELRNAVARALTIGVPGSGAAGPSGQADGGGGGQAAIDLTVPFKEARQRVIDSFERDYLAAALADSGGSITRAAEQVGVNRKLIYRTLRRLGVEGSEIDPD
jgi:DNA-binding NtrC family response regulator